MARASANAQCTSVLPVVPAPSVRNVGFPKVFHMSRAFLGMTRFYMSVVLVVLACPMLQIMTNMNAGCTVSSSQKFAFPTIFDDFEKLQDFYNARDPAPVHSASRIAYLVFARVFTEFLCGMNVFLHFQDSLSL